MIVTVTLNPSLDRTMDVAELRHGQVNRALSTHLHPGGKGVNV
ncbi:MAG: 1-phosphofructokinase, partial [Actinotalea sp.]|nr:1-phosphofructokinase [Actinotalea sp.]